MRRVVPHDCDHVLLAHAPIQRVLVRVAASLQFIQNLLQNLQLRSQRQLLG